MRIVVLTLAAAAATVSIGIAPTPVQARDYPFCIKGDSYASAVGDCSFDTYAQCLATASGRLAYCDANPFFAYPGEPGIAGPGKPHRRR
jgi:hypothetical protein